MVYPKSQRCNFWRAFILLGLLHASLGSFCSAGEDKPFFRAQHIFKPTLRYPRCHTSTIASLPDGSLMAAWWNGPEEGNRIQAIRSSKRPAGETSWEPPRILVNTPEVSDGNPVLYLAPNGELWFFYRSGMPWLKILWMKSTDLGRTWSEPAVFVDEPGWIMINSILTLANGDIVIPVGRLAPSDDRFTRASSAFIYSRDGGKSWERSLKIESDPPSNEPTIIQRSDGSLLGFMRSYARSRTELYIRQSESLDNGRTWSAAIDTDLRNPSSAIELLKLESGRLLLGFNDSQETRTPLCLALSCDDGKSWSHRRVIEDAPGRFSYPTLTQSGDGHIHVSYTFRRTNIKHVEVNEAWLLERPWRQESN
jgi:predicted neuraminidase